MASLLFFRKLLLRLGEGLSEASLRSAFTGKHCTWLCLAGIREHSMQWHEENSEIRFLLVFLGLRFLLGARGRSPIQISVYRLPRAPPPLWKGGHRYSALSWGAETL
jgi:hypothetical protein